MCANDGGLVAVFKSESFLLLLDDVVEVLSDDMFSLSDG